MTQAQEAGVVLGIPRLKAQDPGDPTLPIDRLIRALTGLNWACLVMAEPVEETISMAQRRQLTNEIRIVQAAEKDEGVPSGIGQHYNELLKQELKSITSSLAIGAWRTAVYLLGDSRSYRRLAGVWRGIYSGSDSTLAPLHIFDSSRAAELAAAWAMPDDQSARGPGVYHFPYKWQTILTSTQLAAYVQLPHFEVGGFRVSTVSRFDSVPAVLPKDQLQLAIGHVLSPSLAEGEAYRITLDSLTQHTLVAGVTGAGKTRTIFHLLRKVTEAGINFLVIEPAKREYRQLLRDPALGPKLRIFTLGNENGSRFRLNPFEAHVIGDDGSGDVSVSTHIELLRSTFNASFGMWTPLPQVLERCLNEIYADRGWDLARNSNHRLRKGEDPRHPFQH